MTDPELNDLGFGQVAAQQVHGRFLSKDGSPNTRKYGLGARRWARFYRRALAMGWPGFLLWLAGLELLANGIFALGYLALGPGAIAGTAILGLDDPFLRAFTFSVDVFTTVGTGGMHPVGSTANWLAIIESLAGPLFFVIGGGLVIARLMRPRSRIRFSQSAVIAPYRGGRGLMFRLINAGVSEMDDVRVEVNLVWYEEEDGKRLRRFHKLSLERDVVEFFSLHWTVVHPIDSESPLRGVTPERLRAAEGEIIVIATGLEDTFATRVSARTSYTWDEIRWDAAFAGMFVPSPDDILTV
ncbi:MAG TPA: hypothetical protein VFL95_04580, partial [Gemmatimonadales bacterium]|nr:hypothetical protein [Gemmatimonadales bacterium]